MRYSVSEGRIKKSSSLQASIESSMRETPDDCFEPVLETRSLMRIAPRSIMLFGVGVEVAVKIEMKMRFHFSNLFFLSSACRPQWPVDIPKIGTPSEKRRDIGSKY